MFGFLLHEFDEKSGHYVLLNQVIMPENLPHQDLSESNTILFLTLSAIFLSEGCIGEGMYCHHIILQYKNCYDDKNVWRTRVDWYYTTSLLTKFKSDGVYGNCSYWLLCNIDKNLYFSLDEVWNMLDILGYKPENHKKLVTSDFVRQLYINLEVIPQSDPPRMNFTWGERATIEFTKKEILAFAAKVPVYFKLSAIRWINEINVIVPVSFSIAFLQIYGQPPEQFGTLWNLADKEDKAREANWFILDTEIFCIYFVVSNFLTNLEENWKHTACEKKISTSVF